MQRIENRIFDEIRPGDTASLVRTLTYKDIELFAIMSGDINPTHLDDARLSTRSMRRRCSAPWKPPASISSRRCWLDRKQGFAPPRRWRSSIWRLTRLCRQGTARQRRRRKNSE